MSGRFIAQQIRKDSRAAAAPSVHPLQTLVKAVGDRPVCPCARHPSIAPAVLVESEAHTAVKSCDFSNKCKTEGMRWNI